MKNNLHFIVSVLLAGLIFPIQIIWGQTGWSLTTNKNFNRVIIYNGLNTESSFPVMTPDDQVKTNFSFKDFSEQNNLLTDWTPVQTVGGVVKAISFVNPEVGYMSAELGVVYKTTDGGYNWSTVLNLGFPYYWYGIHAFTTQRVLIAGFNNTTGDGIMRWTTDGGTNWTDDIIVAPAPLNWLEGLGFADSLHGLAVGSILSAGKVFITTNGGINAGDWTPVVADPTQGWFAGNFTMRTDGNYFITGISFCNSTDFGLTWSRRNSIDNTFDGGVTFPDDLHGWTGGGSISPSVEGWVHRTTDGGITWSGRILNTPYPVRVVYFFDSQYGIAQGGDVNSGVGGIYESTDGGVDWTETVNTNLEMASIDWQRVSPDSIDIWSVGYTSSGGFHSVVYKKRISYSVIPVELQDFTAGVNGNDVTLTWTTVTETNNHLFEIQKNCGYGFKTIGDVNGYGTSTNIHNYSYTDRGLKEGTYTYRLKQVDYDGKFRYSGEVEADINSPGKFSLSQNYPNPFNPTTQIEYSIPEDGNVTLRVYNTLGQQVAELVNGNSKAGRYQVTFNAENLSSGVFYYSLQAGDFNQVKKMILLK